MEAAGIHVGKAIAGDKIPEILLKALAGIAKSGGGGKPRARADHHRVRLFQRFLQLFNPMRADFGRCFHPAL